MIYDVKSRGRGDGYIILAKASKELARAHERLTRVKTGNDAMWWMVLLTRCLERCFFLPCRVLPRDALIGSLRTKHKRD